ncbi:MAG: hypothetical protein SFX72_03935 [Isosphaeraceae bacterium]|nr:hypothetical protein [Isosphaeraceae bacterium]
MPEQPKDDPRSDIADAAELFGSVPSSPSPSNPVSGRIPSSTGGDGYELETPADDSAPTKRRVLNDPFVAGGPQATAGARPRPATDAAGRTIPETVDVGPGWSRWAEWGPDLLRLGLALCVLAGMIWATFAVAGEWLWPALGIAIGCIVPLYPILITLERPVRVTPEHAWKDYLAALDHLFPHYRRMWLLLSDRGRSDFADFAEFRAYWDAKRREWRTKATKAGSSGLTIALHDFRTEGKSTGLSRIRGTGTVRVESTRPRTTLFEVRGDVELARGTDRMWYLESGRLPPG